MKLLIFIHMNTHVLRVAIGRRIKTATTSQLPLMDIDQGSPFVSTPVRIHRFGELQTPSHACNIHSVCRVLSMLFLTEKLIVRFVSTF